MKIFKEKKKKLLLEEIKNDIKKAEVVSFDIFDTLLVRPYIKPTDLFTHIEKVYECQGFENERKEAERRCRIRHSELEDITFDMIYDEIDEQYKHMKQKEMDWEEMVLRPNPELKQVYDYAQKLGKKIIIASDMYMPSEFLAKVLRKNGYDGWVNLYVSGDYGKTKFRKSLYQIMINDLCIQPNNILHIGDNQLSDIQSAQEVGLNTVLYKQIFSQYIDLNNRYAELLKEKSNNIGDSIMLSMFAINWQKQRCNQEKFNYWKNLGYNIAGPIVYGYARWLEEEAKTEGIDNLLFIARDGYNIQKVFSSFNKTIKNKYIYAPRFLNMLYFFDFAHNNRYKDKSKDIIDFYLKESLALKKIIDETSPQCDEDYYQIILNNKPLFEELARPYVESYQKYIHNNTHNDSNIGVVDLASSYFSSHLFLENVLNKKLKSFYIALYTKSHIIKNLIYKTWAKQVVRTNHNKNLFLIEYLITSPEHPIENISQDWTPVYINNISKEEKKRSDIYNHISKGILDFANEINDVFNFNDIYVDEIFCIKSINKFIEQPTALDIQYFKNVKISIDASNKVYIPLLSCDIPLLNYIFHPLRTKKEISSYSWKTKLQKFYLKNWGLYKEKTNITDIKRFFGVTIYSRKKEINIDKKSLLGGFIKRIKQGQNKKIYILGIPIYRIKINEFYEIHKFLGITFKRNLALEPIKNFIYQQTNKNMLNFERLNYLIKAQKLHNDTFKNYENFLFNKDAVLVACGPSAKEYKMLKGATHIGVNSSIYFKDLLLDFLFMQDKPVNRIEKKTMALNEDANAYIGNNCKKFYAIIPDIRLKDIKAKIERIPHRYSYLSKNVSNYFLDPIYKGPFAWDLSQDLIADHGGTVFSAMQFLFYTNAKRIFLVGCDCSDGHALKNIESCDFYKAQRQSWTAILNFKQMYYPETEIISINPVGLKGLFKDVYTMSYLQKHPEINPRYVEILKEEEVENYV